MTTSRVDEGLKDLATLCGVERAYRDDEGTEHVANDDVVLALLRALGVPLDRAADAPDALRARRLADARRMLEPVSVLRVDRPGAITVTLPKGSRASEAWLTINREDGTTRRERLLARRSTVLANRVLGGDHFERYRVDFNEEGGETMPLGYHEVNVELAGSTKHASLFASALLVSAPACRQVTRGWGVFMPLHALRSDEDWGVGSYSDLTKLGEWVASLGGSMVGGLPLYPGYLDSPVDPSPYRPVSRLAYNELYIDPVALPELALSREACARMGSANFVDRVRAVHCASLVEYEEVSRLRREVLEPMADTLLATSSPRRDEFHAFLVEHPELVAYAHFRATLDRVGRDRVGDVAAALRDESAPEPTLGYHLYCQWAANQQLAAAGNALALYADLPVGVHPDGFDPYWSPRSFLPDVRGGAPPDQFFREGQDWGFPPLHPDQIRDDGYRYFIAVLGRVMRHASYVRVDHVMGLQRLYMMPEGADAQHGAYVTYRADEMFALVALESTRGGAAVIGEDLGTVADEVHRRMTEDRMLRSWVFEFESSRDDPLPAASPEVLASLATHDTPRFSSYLWGKDVDEAEAAGQCTADEALTRRGERTQYRIALLEALDASTLPALEVTRAARRGCLAHLAASDAKLVLVDLEELWGEDQPQNRPGTSEGNWRGRGALTLAETCGDAVLRAELEGVDQRRKGCES